MGQTLDEPLWPLLAKSGGKEINGLPAPYCISANLLRVVYLLRWGMFQISQITSGANLFGANFQC